MTDLCSIRKIQNAINRFEATLKEETGLSLNEAMCLCCITSGILEPGRLARELGLSPSRLTRILDNLAERKMIKRAISKSDRRTVVISLTKPGKKIIEAYKCANIEIPSELAFTRE